MRAKDLQPTTDIPLSKPKGVSDTQWNIAKSVYIAAAKAGDKFPELTVAQAALETGWFKHVPATYNYFGQKAGKNEAGNVATTKEASNNSYYTTKSKFKSYNNLDTALQDRVKKWGSKYQNASNVSEALYSIWQYNPEKGRGQGYATAPDYDKKIGSVLSMMGSSFSAKPSNYTPSQDTVEDVENPNEDFIAKFSIESGDFNPTYTNFTYDIEKEAIKESKGETSQARSEIEEVKTAKQQYLEQYALAMSTPVVAKPQEDVQTMSDEEAYSSYMTEIPVQNELPQLDSLFTTGQQ